MPFRLPYSLQRIWTLLQPLAVASPIYEDAFRKATSDVFFPWNPEEISWVRRQDLELDAGESPPFDSRGPRRVYLGLR